MKSGLPVCFYMAGAVSQQSIQTKNTYINLFNTQMDGMQEDKLRQALESYYYGNYSFCVEVYRELIPSFAAKDHQEAVINSLFLLGTSFLKLGKTAQAMDVYRLASVRVSLMLEKSALRQYYYGLYFAEMGEALLERIVVFADFKKVFCGLEKLESS